MAKIHGWKPEVGELALVPGGPANAWYIAELNEDDVKAILSGHRGYAPLRVKIVDTSLIGTRYNLQAIRMVLVYKDGKWHGDGVYNTLDAALKRVRYIDIKGKNGRDIILSTNNECNQAYFNPSKKKPPETSILPAQEEQEAIIDKESKK